MFFTTVFLYIYITFYGILIVLSVSYGFIAFLYVNRIFYFGAFKAGIAIWVGDKLRMISLLVFTFVNLIFFSGGSCKKLNFFYLSACKKSVVETIWAFVEELRILLFFGLRRVAKDFKDAFGEFIEIQVLFLAITFLDKWLLIEAELSSLIGLWQQENIKLEVILDCEGRLIIRKLIESEKKWKIIQKWLKKSQKEQPVLKFW